MNLQIKLLSPSAAVPVYASEGAAAFDFFVPAGESYSIAPGTSQKVGTKVAMAIPDGYMMLMFSRSGHGAKHGVRLANCVGVIDSDYRGELVGAVANDGPNAYTLAPGERFMQGVVIARPSVTFTVLTGGEELPPTDRGAGGFGSTGEGPLQRARLTERGAVACVSRSNDMEGLVQWTDKRVPAGTMLYAGTDPAPQAVPAQEAAADVDEFSHWLNARRDRTVSEAFHDIVAKYREAARAASALPSVPQKPAPETLQVARGGNEGGGDEGVTDVPRPRPRLRSTHTLAGLAVTAETWNEIANKLLEAGYGHAFTDEGIDMSGIMLCRN